MKHHYGLVLLNNLYCVFWYGRLINYTSVMQPIISPINHESRHSGSYRAQDEFLSEGTPLLTGRQVADSIAQSRNPITTIIVTLLCLLLLVGIVISIYLLVLESNRLPPIEDTMVLVSRAQWQGKDSISLMNESGFPSLPSNMVVVQTETDTCNDTESCVKLLRTIQNNSLDGEYALLPYNFLVSTNGEIYEELGWEVPSSLFPELSNSSLILAFIGNFSVVSPSETQIRRAKDFFDESVSFEHLSPLYNVIVKGRKYSPVQLYSSLADMAQFVDTLSDL